MARFLLDTHTFLWLIREDPELGAGARRAIDTPDNEIFVSAISLYEIAYKSTWGRLDAPGNLEELVDKSRYIHLPLSLRHAEQAALLHTHHKDPFDRMLVAQATVDGLILITADSQIRRFGVPTLEARR